MVESVGRDFHPLYSGSGGASLRVGQLADGTLQPGVGRVGPQPSDPLEQRPGERMPSISEEGVGRPGRRPPVRTPEPGQPREPMPFRKLLRSMSMVPSRSNRKGIRKLRCRARTCRGRPGPRGCSKGRREQIIGRLVPGTGQAARKKLARRAVSSLRQPLTLSRSRWDHASRWQDT